MYSVITTSAMATVTAGLPGQVTSLSACFTLQGTYTNGTSVGYLAPEDFGYGVWSVFTSQSSQAAKLGLDTTTKRLVNYDGTSGQQWVLRFCRGGGDTVPG